jgi:hypothetical protein
MGVNTKSYINNFLFIVDKNSKLRLFDKFTMPQEALYERIKEESKKRRPLRFIVLKARQMGFSTLVEGIGFKRVATENNIKMAIVTHKDDATRNLYEMTRRYYDNLIPELKPKTESYTGYGLQFGELKSSIVCYTAGGQGIGRSATINILHASEVAFWPGDISETLDGLLQAVPDNENSMIFLESTAKGFNKFKDIWDAAVNGENDYIPIFAAWHQHEEYVMDPTGFIINEDIERYGNEQELKELYNLSDGQLAWRRSTIKNKLNNDLSKFKQEYPSNPLEAFIFSGDSVFNNERVINHIEHIKKDKPVGKGYFTYETHIKDDKLLIIDETIRWVDDPYGDITLYEKPVVQVDERETRIAPYVLGGDTAGVGEDYFTAKVINNITKKDAAVYIKQRVDEGLYAEQMYCLAHYYHKALIGIEVNYSIYPTRRLMELGARQYARENIDNISKVMVESLGFKTTVLTRPAMIEHFKDIVRENIHVIRDITTLREMLTFVKDDKGKAQAIEGKHDDMIMATMIAHAISHQQSSLWQKHEKEKVDVIQAFFGRKKTTTDGGLDEW